MTFNPLPERANVPRTGQGYVPSPAQCKKENTPITIGRSARRTVQECRAGY